MIQITGRGLGPSTTAGAELDTTGRVSTVLAGTRVLFDGTPAPLVSAQESLILCMTPFEVAGKSLTAVPIERNGVAAPGVLIGVTAAALEPCRRQPGWDRELLIHLCTLGSSSDPLRYRRGRHGSISA
jgi:uncharacterized protein (TIGR03437 family)